jgi:hypothetical protein
VQTGLLKNVGLDEYGQKDVMEFIETYKNDLRELSLRMALKIGSIRHTNKSNWTKIARVTCCKG